MKRLRRQVSKIINASLRQRSGAGETSSPFDLTKFLKGKTTPPQAKYYIEIPRDIDLKGPLEELAKFAMGKKRKFGTLKKNDRESKGRRTLLRLLRRAVLDTSDGDDDSDNPEDKTNPELVEIPS